MISKSKRHVVVVLLLAFSLLIPVTFNSLYISAASKGKISDGVTGVYFRESPGGNPIKDSKGNIIYLSAGQELTITDATNSSWYKVSLSYGGAKYNGYVSAQFITVVGDGGESAPAPAPQPSSDSDFEAKLAYEGFPESYKVLLRDIHNSYPNWEFEAVHTGLDWNYVVDNEVNRSGQIKNLIYGSSSNPHYNWRSTGVGYSIKNNSWSPFDGSTWFAASDQIVAYYLDPRTYLYEDYIFVFECLSYIDGYQNQRGVEAILDGSFMYNSTTVDSSSTYSSIIMQAASESGVSPYHIASRIKLEMGSSGGVCAFGNSGSHPGIFNFYNIGAYDSADGSAADSGLAWAANSGSYGRPWNTAAKSIIGGAQFLGRSYIGVGQDTLYTQKFNVTNTGNLFSHQYMTNVQAPAVECLANYNAYAENNLLSSTMYFKIPVYINMPDSAVTKPADSGNPNNWLKSLSISGYTLTPSFGINNTTDYSLIVNESVDSINISADPVCSTSSVSGAGRVNLSLGTNIIKISVTSQSGNTRVYKLSVVRGKASAPGGENTISGSTRGDLNGDGKISAKDIIVLQRIIVGLDSIDEDGKSKADLNGDGKISAKDIIVIQRHIVGLEYIN